MKVKGREADEPGARTVRSGAATADGVRRAEILETAAGLFASAGYVGTSLKAVADASGILPGSLYHHFASKEAIALELVERYHDSVDAIGQAALEKLAAGDDRPIEDQIIDFATSIAIHGVRNGAALQLTLFEPQSGAGVRLVELSQRKPQAINTAMAEILHRGQAEGYIRADLDIELLAQHFCEIMLHVGRAEFYVGVAAEDVAATLCHMMLNGVATTPPKVRALDQSSAMAAAKETIRGWDEDTHPELDERTAALLDVARVEFARRGYEATTIRDIASAAGMGTGSVYRFIESKEALLESIMTSFHSKITEGYSSVLATDATVIERLDALTWLNINVLERFALEFRIQASWIRHSPPYASNVGVSLRDRAAQLRTLVRGGLSSGELDSGGASPDLFAMGMRDLIWLPPQISGTKTNRALLSYFRSVVFRGAAVAGAGSAPLAG